MTYVGLNQRSIIELRIAKFLEIKKICFFRWFSEVMVCVLIFLG